LTAAEQGLNARLSAGGKRVANVVEPYLDAVRREVLIRPGRREEGDVLLREMDGKTRAIPGPDAWSQALFRLKSIARIAPEAGDWDLAEFTARQMLEHEHEGDVTTTHEELTAAEKLWSKADPDLPELALAPEAHRTALTRSLLLSNFVVSFCYGHQSARKTAWRGRLLPRLRLARPAARLLS
jgi:hypothetical protein